MGALLKLASMEGLNAPELVFYRSLFSLPVVLFWVLKRESLASLKPNRPLAHVWRSCLGLLSMGLTFQALILLPLADATAINFTAPIFATILSFLILREDVGLHRWGAVVLGFVGVLIVARPAEWAGVLPAHRGQHSPGPAISRTSQAISQSVPCTCRKRRVSSSASSFDSASRIA